MTTWRSCVTVAACLTAGCSAVTKELRNDGGVGGAYLDKRMFDASGSKQLQLLRATMIISMASRVGTATVRDGREADAFVDYLQNATEEVNVLAGHLYDVEGRQRCAGLGPEDGSCHTHAIAFEADLPLLEYKIVRLVLAALPQRQAASFARALGQGNVLSAAYKAIRLAASSLDGFHRGAAVYRSTLEVRALLVASGAGCTPLRLAADGEPIDPERLSTKTAVQCLGLESGSLRNPADMPALPATVRKAAFAPLYGIIRTSCGLLPINIAINDELPVQGGAGAPEQSALTRRQNNCRSLRFEPALRFDGAIERLEAAPPPSGPVVPATVSGVPRPDDQRLSAR